MSCTRGHIGRYFRARMARGLFEALTRLALTTPFRLRPLERRTPTSMVCPWPPATTSLAGVPRLPTRGHRQDGLPDLGRSPWSSSPSYKFALGSLRSRTREAAPFVEPNRHLSSCGWMRSPRHTLPWTIARRRTGILTFILRRRCCRSRTYK